MTHKVTVRFGGAADSEVHDYSDRIRLLGDGSPLIYGGMACDNGTAGMGQLILDDDDNDIPHRTDPPGLQLAAHNQLIWSEDSPGYESWLSIGRIDNKSVGRPYTYTAGVNRQWTVQWADANIDFDGLTLTEDWVRPAESDVDRVLAAVAAFCNGSPRLTTVFETHLVSTAGAVTMPAKTYPAGTELPELFDDCASVAGKVYSVVIHDQDSASHTCLLYIDEEDHDTYACTLSISDQLDEVDGEAVFEPVWRQGGATEEQGQELITGLVSRYGLDTTATAVVTDSTHADLYDYWVKPYNDDLAATATEATNRATAMVHARWTEHVTHQPSILIPARLHYLLKAGMSISIKAAAAMGGQYLNTEQTRRIANIEWSHAGWRGTDAMLWANLQLDRTPRKLPLSTGTKPGPKPASCDNTPSVVRSWPQTTATTVTGMTVEGNANTALIAVMSHISGSDPAFAYDPDGAGGSGPTYEFTKYKELVNTGGSTSDLELDVFYLLNPVASVGSAGAIDQSGGGDLYTFDIILFQDINPDDLFGVDDSFLGITDSATSCTNDITAGTRDLVLSLVGYTTQQTAASAPAPGASQTLLQASDGSSSLTGQDKFMLGVSTRMGTGGTTTDSWTQSGGLGGALTQWDLVINGCDPAITIGGPGEGTTGGGTDYVPGGTVVEHGDLSGKGGTMHDATQIEIADSGGYYSSDDVEGALQEAEADLAAHTADTTDAHDASAISIADSGGYFTGTDVETALQELGAGGGGGGSALTVEEVDGSPTDSAVTKLIFPNGTLSITSHEATYTPAGGGGSGSYPLDTAYSQDATYWQAFDFASLPATWTRRNFTSGAETYQQGVNGDRLRIAMASRGNGDGYYRSVSGDGTWAMKCVIRGQVIGWGLGIVDSSGTGVSSGLYNNPTGHLIVNTTTYSTYGGSFQNPTPLFATSGAWPPYYERPVWMYLRRSSNNYYVAYSLDGEGWSAESPALSAAITPDRIFFGFNSLANNAGSTLVEMVWFNKIA